MEPITLGVLVAAAITGTIGNITHDALRSSWRLIRDQLKDGKLPRNHDVERATRRAQMLALHLSLKGYKRLSETRADARWFKNPKHQIADPVSRLVHKALRPSKFKERSKASAQILARIEQLFLLPEGSGASAMQDELRKLCEDWTLEEVRIKDARDWPRFERLVREGGGEGEHAVPAWWDMFRVFMAEEIKNSEGRVAKILTQQGIASILDLSQGLKAALADMQRNQEALAEAFAPALAECRQQGADMDRQLQRFGETLGKALSTALQVASEQQRHIAISLEHRAISAETRADARKTRENTDRLVAMAEHANQLRLARYVPLSVGEIANLPTRLVVADHGVVPYEDITDLAAQMLAWARSGGGGVLGRLIVGGGGYGKTRIALHVAETLFAEGWRDAGLLSSAEFERDANDTRLRSSITDTTSKGVFLVFDYAEARVRQIRTLVRAAKRASGALPVRILLLARSAGAREGGHWRHTEGDWWHTLLNPNEADTAPERQTFEDTPFFAEAANAVPPDKRDAFIARAVAAFEARLGAAKPDLVAPANKRPPIARERLAGAAGASPLLLSFEAFLHMRGVALTGSAIAEMARDEAKHWSRALGSGAPNLQEPLARAMQRGVALVTLTQGAESAQVKPIAKLAVERVYAGVADRDAAADARVSVAGAIAKLYDDGRRLRPVQPDLLGEHMVGEALAAAPDLAGEALDAFPGDARAVLTVLNRATKPVHDAMSIRAPVAAALELALPTRIAKVAEQLVFAVISEEGELQGVALKALGALPAGDRQAAGQAIIASAGRQVRENATPVRLRALFSGAAGAAGLQAEHPDVDDPHAIAHRAEAFFAAAGRTDAKELAAAIAGPVGKLVESSRQARQLKRLEDLTSQFGFLAQDGRRKEARDTSEEAARIGRELVQEYGEEFLPHLALAVHNLAGAYTELGLHDLALAAITEAIRIRRDLTAKGRADGLPRLVSSLTQLSTILVALGRGQDAQKASTEAVGSLRGLVARNREAFAFDLALALDAHAGACFALGLQDEAIGASLESVGIKRQLVERDRDAFLPHLATALSNVGAILLSSGRVREALPCNTEAVKLHRELVGKNRNAFLPTFGSALNNTGATLLALGQVMEASTHCVEAVTIRRELVAMDRRRFLPGLVEALSNSAAALQMIIAMVPKALEVSTEALTLGREIMASGQTSFAVQFTRTCGVHAHILRWMGRPDEAVPILKESLAALSPLMSQPNPVLAKLRNQATADLGAATMQAQMLKSRPPTGH